jgi:hypothetical protein
MSHISVWLDDKFFLFVRRYLEMKLISQKPRVVLQLADVLNYTKVLLEQANCHFSLPSEMRGESARFGNRQSQLIHSYPQKLKIS